MTKPLILSPAGSFESLIAAVEAGADEVYFGLPEFNARYNAKNFTDDELKEALKMCRVLGVKSNITVNTLITDKEMPKALGMVYNAASLGADAFIVQDLGFASNIKERIPQAVLHASTQCACHNAEGAKLLSELGFDRVVLAREMPKDEIKKVADLGIETEIFVHGALCVCQSGMCLMSSVIGDRSGNRGLCAQPCRLPYTMAENKNRYPLSLKDLSLGTQIESLCSLGVTSLKIEGRMKSPEYVYATTKIWRDLIDGGRNADKSQMKELESIFSRGGFTDKYFTGGYRNDNTDMYGIRSDGDKQNTRDAEKKLDFSKVTRRRNVSICCVVEAGKNLTAGMSCDSILAEYTSDFVCPEATGRPVDESEIKASLMKLGNTYFTAEEKNVNVTLCGNVFLSKAMLNSVRRGLCERMEQMLCQVKTIGYNDQIPKRTRREKAEKTEILVSCKSLSAAKKVKAENALSIPLYDIEKLDINELNCGIFGVTLPRVVYSSEMESLKMLLEAAKEKGAEFALASNIGQVKAVRDSGLLLYGDIGMNVFNSSTVKVLEDMGFSLITVSPELNEAQVRDIEKKPDTKLCAFVKGRLPLMVLESCIVKAGGGCRNECEKPCTVLRDRKNMDFPVYGERRLTGNGKPCRNIIYNSVETDILSKDEKMSKMNVDTAMVYILE